MCTNEGQIAAREVAQDLLAAESAERVAEHDGSAARLRGEHAVRGGRRERRAAARLAERVEELEQRAATQRLAVAAVRGQRRGE